MSFLQRVGCYRVTVMILGIGAYRRKPFRAYRAFRACRLTNYEPLWECRNRGDTGREAYDILRWRVDQLIDQTYPQFCEDKAPTDIQSDSRPE